MKGPKASIIIPTLNAGDKFDSILNSIENQSFRNFEIIVVDSDSRDDTLIYAKNHKCKIIQIKKEEFGHGKTRHLAAQKAKGEFLVFMTQDAMPANKEWLKELIAPLKNDKIAGVYSRQIPKEKENIIEKFFYLSLYPKKEKIWAKQDHVQGNNIFSNVSSAIKKFVYDKYPFREDMIVSEDWAWAKEVLNAGYEIYYNPQSEVVHSHTYGLKSLFKRNFDIGVSHKQIFGSNGFLNFIKKGSSIHYQEIKFLVSNGKAHLIPYCIIKDATKFIAINLGKKSHLLPNALNRNFSNYGGFWR